MNSPQSTPDSGTGPTLPQQTKRQFAGSDAGIPPTLPPAETDGSSTLSKAKPQQLTSADPAGLPTIPPTNGESMPAPTLMHSGAPAVSTITAPPGFEILGELGRGGMGVVYHARQTKLNREVALKMILSGGHSSEVDRARFLAEAIASLNHPGIVQVFEFGTHAGQPYFALEYCPGGSLAKHLDGTPLPPNDAATLVQKIAYAVHAAHEKGIVHRDLKPANVLLTAIAHHKPAELPSETAITAGYSSISSIKVTDFGLAKRLEDGSDLTKSGAIMGTPSYMAAEQAVGDGKRIGPATDVYALGVILYELLTGRPPFKEATPMDTVLRVIDEEPVRVRHLQKKTPVDLETICHKCLHKDPQRRYGSAGELADDLARWQRGEPARAQTLSLGYRTRKWIARHRRRAAVLGGLALVQLAVVVVVGWWVNRAVHNSMREQRVDELKTILNSNVAALRAWLVDQASTVDSIARDERLFFLVDELLKLSDGKPGLEGRLKTASAQKALRDRIDPTLKRNDFFGFFVVAPDGVVLAADTNEQIGQTLRGVNRGFTDRALMGEPIVSRPYRSPTLLMDEKGEKRANLPTMFAEAPIRDAAGKSVAVFGGRIRPDQQFTRILQVARFGDTGETYAFDRNGLMISQSRFDDSLKQIGLLDDQPDVQSIPAICFRQAASHVAISQ